MIALFQVPKRLDAVVGSNFPNSEYNRCEITFVPANVAACRMSVRISSFETGAPWTRSSWNFESLTLLPK